MLTREQFAALVYELADDYLIGKKEHQQILDHDAALRAELERLAQALEQQHGSTDDLWNERTDLRKEIERLTQERDAYHEAMLQWKSWCEQTPSADMVRHLAQAQAELKNWKRFYTNVIDPLLSGLILGQAKLDFFQGWAKSVQREAVQEAQRGGA